jgi:hypothetical protein
MMMAMVIIMEAGLQLPSTLDPSAPPSRSSRTPSPALWASRYHTIRYVESMRLFCMPLLA